MSSLLLIRVQQAVEMVLHLLCRGVGDAFVISLTVVLVRFASLTGLCDTQTKLWEVFVGVLIGFL